jgi:leucine efflux protein
MDFITNLGIIGFSTYILGTIAIILLPGPNSMYVLTTAAKQGVRRGYAAACGVFIGDAVLMVAAVIGATTVLREAPQVFMSLKITGALYLAYLGIQMLIGAHGIWQKRDQLSADAIIKANSELDLSEAATLTVPVGLHPFKGALLISLINPKAILFILSFFLQFVSAQAAHPMWAFVLLGSILQLFSFIYLSGLIFAGARLADEFRSRPLWMVGGTVMVGLMFIGFGVRLGMATL